MIKTVRNAKCDEIQENTGITNVLWISFKNFEIFFLLRIYLITIFDFR